MQKHLAGSKHNRDVSIGTFNENAKCKMHPTRMVQRRLNYFDEFRGRARSIFLIRYLPNSDCERCKERGVSTHSTRSNEITLNRNPGHSSRVNRQMAHVTVLTTADCDEHPQIDNNADERLYLFNPHSNMNRPNFRNEL
jgi:hypothetical protein